MHGVQGSMAQGHRGGSRRPRRRGSSLQVHHVVRRRRLLSRSPLPPGLLRVPLRRLRARRDRSRGTDRRHALGSDAPPRHQFSRRPSGGRRQAPPLTPSAARAEIAERGRAIGFDHLGVAAATPPPEVARFDAWVARGYHAGMDYLVRSAAERRDPSLLLRDARSILVGAVRYVAGPAEPASPLSGEVAGYARGGDYHLRVGAMGSELATYLRTRFDARAAEYVDTGAILERLWAAHAGVGWIGKNALVLNRESGSYFFLAVVVTDLELPPDAPALDECGQCTLCIEACPTGAIVEPKVVDSRLCLSYHTIELRG